MTFYDMTKQLTTNKYNKNMCRAQWIHFFLGIQLSIGTKTYNVDKCIQNVLYMLEIVRFYPTLFDSILKILDLSTL